MKASVPMISPLLRSDTQGHLLAQLLLTPERNRTLTELAAAVGTTMPTVHREVERLIESGFATERRSGRNRYISANTEHPLYTPVRQIIEYAYGPRAVLPPLLAPIAGVDEAYVYGSWAARLSGEPGPDPADIDVLVIGRPDRSAIYDAAAEASERLSRDVNIRSVSRAGWDSEADAFIRTLKSRPLVPLDLGALRSAGAA
ncbi:ArsR family transcriptional regulator [Plantibacter sp. YIM 135249]|jgi:hypothetical protein|uniref:ArsR family transcriptional regulator n=1 Tax=Plantibacter sp. YIM 135249 TaxID=3423918 RepID=UPI003D329600